MNMSATDKTLDIDELKRAVKRRIKPAVLSFAGIVALFVLVALLLPPVYRSSATVLIEQQEIPQDLVRSTVTSFADQRIQMIIQRAMTFAKLSEIIKKYDLYADMRETKPLELVVERMRKDIDHQMINADVVDPRSGRPVEATIAFSIAYHSERADVAQRVANEIVSIFLEENLRNRSEMADQAEAFLAEELVRLQEKARTLESKLAAFKEINLRQLPEQTALNISMLDRKEKEHDEISRQIQSLEERKVYLAAQLSQIEPYSRIIGDGADAVMTTEGRVRLLQNRYLSLSGVYSQDHPDVVRTRRELDELLQGGTVQLDRTFVEKQLAVLQTELDKKSVAYLPDHPDLQKLSRQIGEYRVQLSSLPASRVTNKPDNADNPAYIQLAASLESAEIELFHLRQSRKDVGAKLADLEKSLVQSPVIEKEYRDLLRDYENTSLKYQEVKAKQLEAQMAKTLEKDRKGERFTLIEPPLVPERPVKPNRFLILVVGVFVALVGGAGVIWGLEQLDQTVRSGHAVARLTGMSPLAVVPHIVNAAERARDRRKLWITASASGALAVILMVVLHFAVAPLDVLWFIALRKFA